MAKDKKKKSKNKGYAASASTKTIVIQTILINENEYPLDKLVELCTQDAFTTEFGGQPVFIHPEKPLVELGLLIKRTRGSVYGSNELRDLIASLYPDSVEW